VTDDDGGVGTDNITVTVSPPLAAVTTENLIVPFVADVLIPSSGEVVHLEGKLHIVLTSVVDGDGGLHISGHFQPQGVKGVGSLGNSYVAVGITRSNFNIRPPFPNEQTYVNDFYIIGQAKADSFKVHQTIHITVNANGEVTATVDNTRITSK